MLKYTPLKPVIFESEDGRQKITVTVTERENDDMTVNVVFDPLFSKQNTDSLHYLLANQFIKALKGL